MAVKKKKKKLADSLIKKRSVQGEPNKMRGTFSELDASLYPFGQGTHTDMDWQLKKFRTLSKKLGEEQRSIIEQAYEFAAERHATQKRKGGSEFMIHPLRMANIIMGEWGSTDAEQIAASLLHDVVEDTTTTVKEIKDAFGDGIGKLVDGMTMWKGSETPEAYLRRISKGSERLKTIKCADTLDNLRSWYECDAKEANFPQWWKQANEYVLPMARDVSRQASSQIETILEHPWFLEKAEMLDI